MKLDLSHQVVTMIAIVTCACIWKHILRVQDSDTNLGHLIAIEGVVFGIEAEDDSVCGELVCDRTRIGDALVIAMLKSESIETEAVMDDLKIRGSAEALLELSKRGGARLASHTDDGCLESLR
jgi:hypothetical protein